MLYSFTGGSDGGFPVAGLTNVDGVLYGTTNIGGANGYGTVFKITTSGAESVIHSFGGGKDGSGPFAGLTNVNGVLYGTTEAGGANGGGTVFRITTSGAERVLYSFAGGTDGSEPEANLTELNGVLYGTTSAGGADSCDSMGCGIIFAITTSGAESVLYRFPGGSDGEEPSGLTDVGGVLYGTLGGGGVIGAGAVFKVTTSGAESVIYKFKGGSDGEAPNGLANVNGVLYGTTYYGGMTACTGGCGTVFKVTTSGAEQVLHRFGGGRDGANPVRGMTNINGVLYGMTYGGGETPCPGGCGTVFDITTTGAKSALYRFAGRSDGAGPLAGLIDAKGVLYGTTGYGGPRGHGTVFSLSL